MSSDREKHQATESESRLTLDLLPPDQGRAIELPRHAAVTIDPAKADDVTFGDLTGRRDGLEAHDAATDSGTVLTARDGAASPLEDRSGEQAQASPVAEAPTGDGASASVRKATETGRDILGPGGDAAPLPAGGHVVDASVRASLIRSEPEPVPAAASPHHVFSFARPATGHSDPAPAVDQPGPPPDHPPPEDPPVVTAPHEPPVVDEPPEPPIAHQPHPLVLSVAPASGDEDTAIPLSISVGASGDHGPISIQITGVPDGAILSAGMRNPDGSWTLTPDQLGGLTVTPRADSNGDFTLGIAATAGDGSASAQSNLVVVVEPVSDAPTMSVSDVSGREDSAIPLEIAAELGVTSETLSVSLAGLPAGASLSAGTDRGDGTWILSSEDLPGLHVVPPVDFSGDFALSVTAVSTDGSAAPASVTTTLTVSVDPVSDAPTLQVSDVHGLEDAAIPLDIRAALTDGSELLSVTISGVPSGAIMSAGTCNPDGTWTLTPDQLAGLTLTPPANSHADFVLDVTATSTDGSAAPVSVGHALSVTVDPVPDAPVATSVDLGLVTDEDTRYSGDLGAFAGDLQLVTDADGDPIEAWSLVTVTVDGQEVTPAQAGIALTADGHYVFDPRGLALYQQLDSGGSATVSVTYTASDGTLTSNPATITFEVAGRDDAPVLQVGAASGLEDTAIPLGIRASVIDASETASITISGAPTGAVLSAGTQNADGTWTLTPDQLSGLTITPPSNSDADFTLTVSVASQDGSAIPSVATATLSVAVSPVADRPDLAVQDLTTEIARPVIVGGDAGQVLNGTSAAEEIHGGAGNDVISGNGGTGLARGHLDILARLADTDGSETLHIVISGVPSGVTLSAGTDCGGGTWSLQAADLDGLSIVTPQGTPPFALTIEAISQEQADGSTASRRSSITVTTGPAGDILAGEGGDDSITGGAGTDTLLGGTGDDTLVGGSGADLIDGGAGTDTASYKTSSAVTVNLATGKGFGGDAQGDVLAGIENLIGSSHADLLTGDRNDNVLSGRAGDDTLQGGGGADTLDGGPGTDTASYSDSSAGVWIDLSTGTATGGDAQGDVLIGIENLTGSSHADVLIGDSDANVLSGGAGDDILEGGGKADTLDGGAGIDTATYANSQSGVTVDLAAGTGTGGDAHRDVLIGIENLTGSSHADVLTGDSGANVLSGGAGNDVLNGGAGNDVLEGGAGADTLDGGTGSDTVTYASSDAGVTVDLQTGLGRGGHAEGDVLRNVENVTGSSFADRLVGNSADNVLLGGAGNDILDGGAGNDTGYGGTGDDIYLFGAGGGHDLFVGGALGTDTIQLGTGSGESWTFALTSGSVQSTSAHDVLFSSDACGTVTFSDGSVLAFEGVERIRW